MDNDDILLDNFDPFADLEPLIESNATNHDPLASSQPTGSKRAATDDDPTAKRRKARVPKKKLDANLLLSDRGLPRLRHEAPWLRFGPKGQEDANLRKLMEFYQMWAHSLFPSLNFKDFASKATKACSTPRCKTTLATWQQEHRDRQLSGPAGSAETEGNVTTGLSGMTLEDEDTMRRPPNSTHETHTNNASSPSSPRPAPSGGLVASSTSSGGPTASSAPSRYNPFSSDEEDEDRPLFVPIMEQPKEKTITDEQQARIKANRAAALKILAERRRKEEEALHEEAMREEDMYEEDPGAEYLDF